MEEMNLAPRSLKLMAEYGDQCLWDEQGAVQHETVPLSPETHMRLLAWAEVYHARLNWLDPLATPDWSQEDLHTFEQEGRSLWDQLQQELGKAYRVTYFSEKYRREFRQLDELLHLDGESHAGEASTFSNS